MKLLSLETSTENCSVALFCDGKISYKSELAPQKHAELILGMVDSLLKENSVDRTQLDGIILGSGPGSFTGVRIAASTAQGLALGLDLKVAMVTSLKALAIEALEKQSSEYVVSSIDARMGEVYLAVYHVNQDEVELLDEERVLKPQDALLKIRELVKGENYICCGSGIEVLKKAGLNTDTPVLASFPQAQYLLKDGLRQFENNEAVDPEYALPLYVRNEVTWKKVSEQ